jgi:transposase-like protein
MRCIGCGSTDVSERSERTAQGYRRFRCHDCGKQFNERSESLLNRTQYPSDVIALFSDNGTPHRWSGDLLNRRRHSEPVLRGVARSSPAAAKRAAPRRRA